MLSNELLTLRRPEQTSDQLGLQPPSVGRAEDSSRECGRKNEERDGGRRENETETEKREWGGETEIERDIGGGERGRERNGGGGDRDRGRKRH